MDYQVFRHKNGVLRIFNKWGCSVKVFNYLCTIFEDLPIDDICFFYQFKNKFKLMKKF